MSNARSFLDIALPLAELGYSVIPLDGKSPEILGLNWQTQATAEVERVKRFADTWPNANVGVVRTDDYYQWDVDNWEWFAEATSHLPPIYAGLPAATTQVVSTANLGLHIYVAGQKPAWARPVPNPRFKSKEETPDQKPSLIEFPMMTVGPGSVLHNPERDYRARGGGIRKPAPLPKEWLDWLQSLFTKDLSPHTLKGRPLRRGVSLQSLLDTTELKGKYEVVEKHDRTYLFYHSRLGKCLVKNAAHNDNARNNAQCGFYAMKADPTDVGHFCLAAGCQTVPQGQRKAAFSNLGISLDDLLRPKCRDLAKSKNELDQGELAFVADRFIQEEGITGIGGPSGMGKTYMMLALAKHISHGTEAWGFLKCKKYPILYLLAEGGDRALLKRLNQLRIDDSEDFLVRTMSQGPTLALNNPGLVELAKGRVVFLDTFPRWLQGREENSSTQMAELFQLAMEMLVAGAVAVVLAQHSVKGNSKNPFMMTADCVFRGSGDIVANMACGHGIYQLDTERRDRTLIHVECVKPRDFEPWRPFQLEGKPWIDREGDFKCFKAPSECGYFNSERKSYVASLSGNEHTNQIATIKAKQRAGMTIDQIAEDMGLSPRTVKNRLKEAKESSQQAQDEDIDDCVEDRVSLYSDQ